MSNTLSFSAFFPAAKEPTLRQFIEAFWCEGFLQGQAGEHGDAAAAEHGDPSISTVVRDLVRHLKPAAAALQQFVAKLQNTALMQ